MPKTDETIEIAQRIARSKSAFDSLETKATNGGSNYPLRIKEGQGTIDIPSEFAVPAMRALQAILKQAMKLDAAKLAELTGLPAPKIELEDQETRVRIAQLAITDGSPDSSDNQE